MLLTPFVNSAQRVKALLDTRVIYTSGINSYLQGGYGKFRNNDGMNLSISQAALSYQYEWLDRLSINLVGTGYLDREDNGIGVTEGFLQYKSLPMPTGLRLKVRAGIIYPEVSLENNGPGWSTPYTLTPSLINSWIGEELRHVGTELSLTQLGKFKKSPHDFNLSAAVLGVNDPAGALIAWHGWVSSSRQTLYHESIPLPNPALRDSGQIYQDQSDTSDPFFEADNRIGYHVQGHWRWHGKGTISTGFYDNNARPNAFLDGQYAWHTNFFHAGGKWLLPMRIGLTAQYMLGHTLMQSPTRFTMVDNDFQSFFVMLSKSFSSHRLTLRAERFTIIDNDTWVGIDDNQESGNAATFSYSIRMKKHWFLTGEFNAIRSDRPSRLYHSGNSESDLLEYQLQIASRLYY